MPWRQIVGTRHILSHEYDRLIPAKLWRVLRVHLPPMIAALEAGIDRLPDVPSEG
ncbi:MAG: HepT-like ribonuclease domain-containing protein [Phycisphaerales bacterium]